MVDKQGSTHSLKFSPNGKYLVEYGVTQMIIRETEHFTVVHTLNVSDLLMNGFSNKFMVAERNSSDGTGSLEAVVYRLDTMEEILNIPLGSPKPEMYVSNVWGINDQELLVRVSDEILMYYRFGDSGVEFSGSITIAPGLDVMGLDLTDLHEASSFTPEQKNILHQYGAKIQKTI